MKFTKEDKEEIIRVLNNMPDIISSKNEPIPIVDINTISTNTWLFLRSILGIGGSDESAIQGISPYSNAIKIFKNKFPNLYTNQKITENDVESIIESLENNNKDESYNTEFRLDFGHYMEDFIKNQFIKSFDDRYKDDFELQFAKERGSYVAITDIEIYKDSMLYKHPKLPLFADYDYKIKICFEDGTIKNGIFECKTTSIFKVKNDWSESYPEYYHMQGEHYLAVSGYDFFVIACVADNNANNFYAYLSFKDEIYQDKIVSAAVSFWQENVLQKEMPVVNTKEMLDEAIDLIDVDENLKPFSLSDSSFDLLQKREELTKRKDKISKINESLNEQISEIDGKIIKEMSKNTSSVPNMAVAKRGLCIYQLNIKKAQSSRFNRKLFESTYPELKDKINSCVDVNSTTQMNIKKIGY